MKTLTVTAVFLLVSETGYSQRNSEVDPKDAQIDTLKVQIDSLKPSRDSTSLLATQNSDIYTDSIAVLVMENSALKATVDSVRKAWRMEKAAISQEDLVKANAIYNLKQLKELYDNKIITDAEFITAKKKYLEKL